RRPPISTLFPYTTLFRSTASNITADTTLKLANEFKNIIAIKEASGNLEQVMNIIKHKPKDFLVISGDDMLTLPIIASGGDGVISDRKSTRLNSSHSQISY